MKKKKKKLKDYEAKRVNRTFQTKWMTDRSWLHYEESSNKMYCDKCKHDQMRRASQQIHSLSDVVILGYQR